jgi:hypothetical protein
VNAGRSFVIQEEFCRTTFQNIQAGFNKKLKRGGEKWQGREKKIRKDYVSGESDS